MSAILFFIFLLLLLFLFYFLSFLFFSSALSAHAWSNHTASGSRISASLLPPTAPHLRVASPCRAAPGAAPGIARPTTGRRRRRTSTPVAAPSSAVRVRSLAVRPSCSVRSRPAVAVAVSAHSGDSIPGESTAHSCV